MTSSTDTAGDGINGSEAALGVDRAIMELRRGRAIAIVGERRTLVVAALEATSEARLDQLVRASDRAVLLLTTERAQSAGLNGATIGPVAIPIRQADKLDVLKSYGGMAGVPDETDARSNAIAWGGSKPLAAAGFKLAKAGRLMPALVGFETERFDDASVEQVRLGAILERSDLTRRGLLRISESRLPLADAENTSIILFRDEHSNSEHVAVVIGNPASRSAVPVRLHSACLTGDVLGSLRCDCGEQLHTAVLRIAELGSGVLLYLDHEGRGIGLANKLRAYSIQDTGLDTLDADRHLGFSADERTYDVAAAMLKDIGVTRVEVMTNNPQKIDALREHGIDVVGRLPLVASTNAHNENYLRAKRERAGHLAEDTGS
jgi:GTP cyclohydrolase II